MESYIIRIYRRDGADPDAAAGIAEGSGLEKPAAFSSIGEVSDILRKSPETGTDLHKKYKPVE